jgi:hypothetical protein
VLVVGIIAAAIVMLTNADNGNKWQSQATTSQNLADQLNTQLLASADAATTLKARTVSLAAEKAKAEDNAAVNKVNQSIASTLSKQLDACTESLSTLFDELAAATSLRELQGISADYQSAATKCSVAANGAESLSQYLKGQ